MKVSGVKRSGPAAATSKIANTQFPAGTASGARTRAHEGAREERDDD
jgi:hypothetical protein